MASCTIFIPAYEAEHTIEAVIDRIPKELWDSICAVFVINDGSTDDTSGAVRRAAARYPKVMLHEQAVNQGYGTSVRTRPQLALGTPADYVVCLHADGQYPPEKLPEFLPYMERARRRRAPGLAPQAGHRAEGRHARLQGALRPRPHVDGEQDLRPRAHRLPLGLHALQPARGPSRSPSNGSATTSTSTSRSSRARARAASWSTSSASRRTTADEESHLNPILYGLRCLRVMLRYRLGRYRPGWTATAGCA